MTPSDNPPDDERPRRPSSGPGATHAARQGGAPRPGSGGAARDPEGDRPYNTYGADPRDAGGPRGGGPDRDDRPYNTYSSRPRGLFARLRGEDDLEVERREQEQAQRRSAASDRRGAAARGAGATGGARGGSGAPPPRGRLAFLRRPLFGRRRLTPLRLLGGFCSFLVFWVLLSMVLFLISAQKHSGDLPAGTKSALTSSGPLLFQASTVLVLGLDNRPTKGYSSKEKGANYSERDANTDTIMLWRVGGGVSRRLSIPRDTLVDLPGYGYAKINAAWPYGGPAYAIHTIERFTGIKINHIIIVDLGNFAKFIDDIGGVTVKTPRICSEISGGAADGGFTLDLKPGVHHLTGTEALTLARTRENSCNAAYNDLNREAMQQEIMNAIKSQLFSVHAFVHLPWAAWDAPGAIQTDMGGLTLMQLFVASQIGGSSKPMLLKETAGTYNGQDVLEPDKANVRRQVERLMTGN